MKVNNQRIQGGTIGASAPLPQPNPSHLLYICLSYISLPIAMVKNKFTFFFKNWGFAHVLDGRNCQIYIEIEPCSLLLYSWLMFRTLKTEWLMKVWRMFVFQGWERMGRWRSWSGYVGRTLCPPETGGRTAPCQKLQVWNYFIYYSHSWLPRGLVGRVLYWKSRGYQFEPDLLHHGKPRQY